MRSKNSPDGLSFIERARREQIISCTIESLAADGFARTSIASVAARADISKSVILYHFKSKQTLIESVVDGIYASIGPEILAGMDTDADDYRDMLGSYIRQCSLFAHRHRDQTSALTEIFTHLRGPDGALRYGAETNQPMIEFVSDLLRRGQASGDFAEFDSTAMAISIRSAIDTLPSTFAAYPEIDGEVFSEHLVTIFDKATAAPPSEPNTPKREGQ